MLSHSEFTTTTTKTTTTTTTATTTIYHSSIRVFLSFDWFVNLHFEISYFHKNRWKLVLHLLHSIKRFSMENAKIKKPRKSRVGKIIFWGRDFVKNTKFVPNFSKHLKVYKKCYFAKPFLVPVFGRFSFKISSKNLNLSLQMQAHRHWN